MLRCMSDSPGDRPVDHTFRLAETDDDFEQLAVRLLVHRGDMSFHELLAAPESNFQAGVLLCQLQCSVSGFF